MFWKVIVSAVLLVMLMPGRANAVQYPPTSQPTTTATVRPVVKTVQPKVVRQAKGKAGGVLARTGASNVTIALRIGVVLVVSGFLLYLFGRNRRAARTARI